MIYNLPRLFRSIYIRKILKYRLSLFDPDLILDYDDHYIVTMNNLSGILYFGMRIKDKAPSSCFYEVLLRSEGEVSYLGQFYFNYTFPDNPTTLKVI